MLDLTNDTWFTHLSDIYLQFYYKYNLIHIIIVYMGYIID
jgi:hypothetical protein